MSETPDFLVKALQALVPKAQFISFGGKLELLDWKDERPIPSDKEINDKVTELKADYDAKQYQRERAESYPELKEQLDLLWHAIDGGKFNVKSKDTDFYKKLKAVKDANPKPE